jgi:hypothetical protein
MILALLAIGMVGHLALQTRIQEQGFEIGALQTQAGQLSARQSVLQAMLDQQATPQQLAYAASQAGMVANPYSTFVNLATGQIVGLAKPVTGTEVPIISAAAAPAGTIPAHVAAEAASAQAGPEPTQDLA